jgi:hypothetical protein
MKYGSGAVAQVTSSVIHHGEEQQIIFQGEKARISAPWKVFASKSRPNGFPDSDLEFEDELIAYYTALPKLKHTGHAGQLDDVMAAVEKGDKPFVTSSHGKNTIQLITAIYKAGTTGSTVSFPIEKDDPFYTVKGIMENVPHYYEKSVSVLRQDGEIRV